MKRHCIIFILISCAFILTACNSSPVPENKNLPETSTDFESIEVGTKREDILRSFGEPDSCLSGLFGDIYIRGNEQIIIYYDVGDTGIFDENAIPVSDVSISAYTPQSDELNPQTEAEKQLAAFTEYYTDWQVKEEQDWWGYAVTDLDQDGNLEIISSECHGTGHYTTTSVYEIDSYHAPFTIVCTATSNETQQTLEALSHGGPLGTCLLLAPHQERSGVSQTYPVYYDENQEVYYYIYEDSINNTDGVFNSLRAVSLGCGEISGISLGGEATGILLGCKRTGYHGDYISVDCWDMYGNYIDKDTYGKLAEQYYADLQKKEASILWIECQDLEDLSKEEIYNLLKSSMDSFSLADI